MENGEHRRSAVLVFRAPPLSYEYNVFTLPFPASLWAVAGGMVLLCAALLTLVLRSEDSMGGRRVAQPADADDHSHALRTNSDALLMAVAAVCQQGE